MGGEFEGAGLCPDPSWGEFERGGSPPFHTGSIGPKSGFRFWERSDAPTKVSGRSAQERVAAPAGNPALKRRPRSDANTGKPGGLHRRAPGFPLRTGFHRRR